MKKIYLSLTILSAAAFVLYGCGGSSSLSGVANEAQPRVRAVDAFTGVSQISGQVGTDSLLTSPTAPITYGSDGSYIITKNQSESVSLFDDTNLTAPTAIASLQNILFRIDNYYTLVGYGPANNRQIAILQDTHNTSTAGSASLRFINGVSTIGPVDIYVTPVGVSLPATPTISALALGQAPAAPNDYLSEPVPLGGTAQLEVRVTLAGNPGSILLDVNPITLADEDRWSIVLDDPSGTQTGVGLIKLQDRP